jgi:hypothetical protein
LRKEAEYINGKTEALLDRRLEYNRLKMQVELNIEMISS